MASLMTLPRELRLVIYEYLFDGIEIGLTTERRICRASGGAPKSLAITLVCKALYHDPMVIRGFCSRATFVLCKKQRHYDSLEDDIECLQRITGPELFPTLRCVLRGVWPGHRRSWSLVPGFSMLCGIRELHQTIHNCYCWEGVQLDNPLVPVTSPPIPQYVLQEKCRCLNSIFIEHYMKKIPRGAREALSEALQTRRLTLIIEIKVSGIVGMFSSTIVSSHIYASAVGEMGGLIASVKICLGDIYAAR